MAALKPKKTSRVFLFVAFNVAAVVFVVLFCLAPVLTHFMDRSDEISENLAQLSHFENLSRQAKLSTSRTTGAGDPFWPGGEERVISADLQASLKAMATNAGVGLLGIRGLQTVRAQQMRMITVGVELEGSLEAVRDLVRAIEGQTPLLFVTAASLRNVTDGGDGPVRLELTVQGAMREGPQPGDGAGISR